ncbi:MAG: TapB family protein [Anaerolineales bacterium]
MEQKRIKPMFTPIGVLLIIIFLTACSPSPSIPNLAPQPTETQVPSTDASGTVTAPTVTSEGNPAIGGAGLCTNVYYPVREGATWSYKSTGGPAGEYSFTDTVAAVREDSFTLSTQIADLTRSQEWTCRPQGLAALQLGGAPAAMLNAQNIQLDLEVTNASGVTFPREIHPGDQWQQNLDLAGNVRVATQEGTGTGTAQISFTALGNESVMVPAGTFDALKVEVDTTLALSVTYQGLSLPVTFSGSHTYWFAENVGWVKATGTGNVLGTSFSETTELQSYNIP